MYSRKRKAVNESADQPKEKRTTFTGVLASNAEENISLYTEASNVSSESEIFNLKDSLNKSDSVPEGLLNPQTDNEILSNGSNNMEKSGVTFSQDNFVSSNFTNLVVVTADFAGDDSLKTPNISVDGRAEKVSETPVINMQVCSLDTQSKLVVNSSFEILQTENEKISAAKVNYSSPDTQSKLEVNSFLEVLPQENEKISLTEVNDSSRDTQSKLEVDTSFEALQRENEKISLTEVNGTLVKISPSEVERQKPEITDSSDRILQPVNEDQVSPKTDSLIEMPQKIDDSSETAAKDVLISNIEEETEEELDVTNDDTNDVIIEHQVERPNGITLDDSINSIEKPSDINLDDSNSAYDNGDFDVSDGSMPVVCEESEDLDVLSLSQSDEQNSFDGLNSTNNETFKARSEKRKDDDVTLVEVKKKENTPLAVIDLLSDEEDFQNPVEEVFEESDDEIQVVKVCPGTKSNTQSRNLDSVKSEFKMERSVIKSAADIKSFHSQMQFPNLFRKELYCLSRPPVTLLPSNVRPAKEAYVINRQKSQPKARLWESFKDLQDYQRDRRLNRHLDSSRPLRPGSLRDYRFHNEAQRQNSYNREEQTSEYDYRRNNQNSYNREEHPTDYDFRDNQSFAFQQNRDPFNSQSSLNRLENHSPILPSPFGSPNHMPFMNMNIHSNPAFVVNEIHRTVQTVTSNILTSMLGPHIGQMNLMARSSPTFNQPSIVSQHQFNDFTTTSPLISERPMHSDFPPMRFPGESVYSGDQSPYGMNREPPFDSMWSSNNFRPRNTEKKGPLFPRAYRDVNKKRSWSDIKSGSGKSNDKESDSGSDIEEVPINLNQFLWSNDIQPLIKPGSKIPVCDVLLKLRITQMANLLDKNKNVESILSNPPGLEMSFDVYLPGFKYKKTAPDIPKHRIVVLRSVDPIPKYSDIIALQRKFSDGAILQMAVVDHGDISFYSFNNIAIPSLVPHES